MRLKLAALAGGSVLLTLAIIVVPTFAQIRALISAEDSQRLLFAALGYTLLALLLSVGLAMWGSGRFTRGLDELTVQADRVASGQLRDTELAFESNDEVGRLANSFRDMNRGLRTLVSQLDSSAVDVAATAEQLAASAQEMTASTEQVSGAPLPRLRRPRPCRRAESTTHPMYPPESQAAPLPSPATLSRRVPPRTLHSAPRGAAPSPPPKH